MKAETYQLAAVVESSDLIRAAICDAHGMLDRRNWESSAADFMRSLWSTDCKSCHDALGKPMTKGIDKRLGTELASLRQYLWRESGSHIPNHRMLEKNKPEQCTDRLRWIDTARMIADCLTKQMKEDDLLEVLKTNQWDYQQTEAMKKGKVHKQNLRSLSKKEKKADSDPELIE